MPELSGTQLIVQSFGFPMQFAPAETHRCAICGGLLTREHFSKNESMSGVWQSSQELECKDEEEVCLACRWFTTGVNRINFLPRGYFIIFDGRTTRKMNAAAFFDFIKNGFESFRSPLIIAIANDADRLRRNTAWKLNRSISYSPHKIIVSMFGLSLGGQTNKGGGFFTRKGFRDGTAVIDADTFIPFVNQLIELAKYQRIQFPIEEKPEQTWVQYHKTMYALTELFQSRMMWSEEIFLALYIACGIAYEEVTTID